MSASPFLYAPVPPGFIADGFRTSRHPGIALAVLMISVGLLISIAAAHPSLKSWLDANQKAHLQTATTVLAGEPLAQAALAEPTPSETEVISGLLSPRMQTVLTHMARRYRVSPDSLTPAFVAAESAAIVRDLDPMLIVAVMAIESGFNPYAESTMGAQGLMQVIPRFHLEKIPENAGEQPFFDPVISVRIGAHVLQEAIRMRGGLIPGLQQYGGSSDPMNGYANKVLAEQARLERVVSLSQHRPS